MTAIIYIILLISWKHSPDYSVGGVYKVKQSQGADWIVVGQTTNNSIRVQAEMRKSDIVVTYSENGMESGNSEAIPMPVLFDMVIDGNIKTPIVINP
ncbi:MAG TPA: hypothetical protein VL854_03535 [Nitrososphaeraceae archaeon]|nr:hypothetical protein [Nitrososphaeraceae archaeon]